MRVYNLGFIIRSRASNSGVILTCLLDLLLLVVVVVVVVARVRLREEILWDVGAVPRNSGAS
jgi:hypothetical protein